MQQQVYDPDSIIELESASIVGSDSDTRDIGDATETTGDIGDATEPIQLEAPEFELEPEMLDDELHSPINTLPPSPKPPEPPLRRSQRTWVNPSDARYSPSQWTKSTSHTNWKTRNVQAEPEIEQSVGDGVQRQESMDQHAVDTIMSSVTSAPAVPEEVHDFMHSIYAATRDQGEPATMTKAFSGHESDKWKQATQEEYASLINNRTWTLQELPPNRKAITNKWIFKKKYNQDNTVSRYKARLVVHGFSQVAGEDYFETFAPVIKFPTVRIVLALVAHLDWSFSKWTCAQHS